MRLSSLAGGWGSIYTKMFSQLSCVASVHCNSVILRASHLTLEIKEFRCYEVKIEESEKRPAVTGSQTQDTSGLCHQCSATELWQLDNRQPSHVMFKQSVTFSDLQRHCAGHVSAITRPHGYLPCTSCLCAYICA